MSKKNHNSIEEDLADYVNGIFKKSTDKVAYFLDGSDSNPSDISDWVSSGNDMLDIAISNRKNGGFPVGRITEISGMEASGKSLLACHAMKSTQEKGGIAVYIDTENAASEEFMKAIGVNVSKMLYLSMYTVEDIFDTNNQELFEETIGITVESFKELCKGFIKTERLDRAIMAYNQIESIECK